MTHWRRITAGALERCEQPGAASHSCPPCSPPASPAHRVAALNGLLGVVAGRVKQGDQAHHDPVGAAGAVLCSSGVWV